MTQLNLFGSTGKSEAFLVKLKIKDILPRRGWKTDCCEAKNADSDCVQR